MTSPAIRQAIDLCRGLDAVADPYDRAIAIVSALRILREAPEARSTYLRFVKDSESKLARALADLGAAREAEWKKLTGWEARDFAGDVNDEFAEIACEGHIVEDPHLAMVCEHSDTWLARARDESQTGGTLRP
jgi:hypothetical protein